MSESSSTQNIVIHTEHNTEYVQVKPSKTRGPDENTVVQRAFKQTNKTLYSEDKTRYRGAAQGCQQPIRLVLNLSARLIGQPLVHSITFLLHLHIVCFPVGRMENEEFEGKGKL